jgi:ATP-dependent helicase Lhr and Lhr-like helicase
VSEIDLLVPRVASAFYGRFCELRPIQRDAIRALVEGQNLILTAGTASGKTEAVTAPLISRLWPDVVHRSGVCLLYVAPTKALVNDLEKRLRGPCEQLGLRVGVRHGDHDALATSLRPQVLITTPESLDVLLFRKEGALADVQAVILDEVHLLYNSQRGLQLSILLRRLQARLHRELQWAAISATVGEPGQLREFLFGPSAVAAEVSQPSKREIDGIIRRVSSEAAFLELVRRLFENRTGKYLLFAASRRECERLADCLGRDPALRQLLFTHYSSLSPAVRVETELGFARASSALCIATSTLELGIDIGDIDAVILWDVPGSVESFLQRIGRGNRRSNKCNVICLVPDTSPWPIGDALRFASLLDAARRGEIVQAAPFELFGAVAQQCMSMIASDGGRYTRVADLHSNCDHLAHLSRTRLDDILGELSSRGYLIRHGFKNQFGAQEALHQLVDGRAIYGNFPSSSVMVEVRHGSKVLGEVPSDNVLKLRRGSIVRFKGERWRIRKVSWDGILVEPTRDRGQPHDFKYGTKAPGFDVSLANRMWHSVQEATISADLDVVRPTPFQKEVAEWCTVFRSAIAASQVPYEVISDGLRYFTFAGSIVNAAIAVYTHQAQIMVDDLSIVADRAIPWNSIPADPQSFMMTLGRLLQLGGEQSIFQKMLPEQLQHSEAAQLWVRHPAVSEVLQRLSQAEPVQIRSGFFGSPPSRY